MRIHRTRRIDPDTAEKLVTGRPLGPDAGHDALADLLAALADPPADGEQPGERAVLAAFRERRLSPVQPLGRSRMTTAAAPARRLSAKALVAALATTAVCGVAFAAGTGHLPGVRGDGPARGPGSGGTSASTTAGCHECPRHTRGGGHRWSGQFSGERRPRVHRAVPCVHQAQRRLPRRAPHEAGDTRTWSRRRAARTRSRPTAPRSWARLSPAPAAPRPPMLPTRAIRRSPPMPRPPRRAAPRPVTRPMPDDAPTPGGRCVNSPCGRTARPVRSAMSEP